MLTACAGAAGAPPSSPTPDQRPAHLIAVGGPVAVVSGKRRTPARIGDELRVAAEVVSQAGGAATVALPGGASVAIVGAASYRYAPSGGAAEGQVDAVAPRDGRLELHVALADVSGTGPLHFHAGVTAGTPTLTTVTVFEGVAQVRYAGGSATVAGGQRLILQGPSAGRPHVVASLAPR